MAGADHPHAITARHVASYYDRFGQGTPVWQPSAGNSGYQLGRLAVLPPRRAGWRSLPDCCAIALDDEDKIDSVKLLGTIPTVHLKRPSGVLPSGGLQVAKVGPSTGLTVGTIKGIGPSNFDWPNGRQHLPRALQVAGANGIFAAQGDSGSPVFAQDGTLIGMVLAGSSLASPTHDTIVMYIEDVLDALGMSFAT